MKKLFSILLLLIASMANAQVVTDPQTGGGSSTVTSGAATSGFTASTLVQVNSLGNLASGPKFLSGNLSLEVGLNYCPDAGANDTYTCNLSGGSLSAYSAGTYIVLKANTANTGTATVAVDGLSAITITRRDDSALQTGDISAGDYVPLVYDGNTFRLQRGFQSGVTFDGSTLSVTGAFTVSGVTGTTPAAIFNNSTSTGNILTLQDNGVARFEILDGGNARVASNGAGSSWTLTSTYGIGLLANASWSFGVNDSSGDTTLNGYSSRHIFMLDYSESSTSAINSGFNLTANPGNTSTGFGNGIRLAGQSSTTASQDMARIAAVWTDATHATRSASVDVQTVNNAGALSTTARFPAAGGVQLVTATRPTCDSTYRGGFWYVAGGAGVADTVAVCAKDGADAYAWRTIY